MNAANPIDFDAKLGTLIRRYRMMREVSQSALGDYIGVTFQQIQKYERGINRISVGTLNSIREFLNIPLEEIFETDTAHVFIDEMSLKILNQFNKVEDPKTRKAILGLIDSMLESKNV